MLIIALAIFWPGIAWGKPKMVERPARAMVVTPHPDDAEIGCAGTVALWTKEGTAVVYLLCPGSNRDVDDFVRANARRAGQRAELPYGEAFRRIQFRR